MSEAQMEFESYDCEHEWEVPDVKGDCAFVEHKEHEEIK